MHPMATAPSQPGTPSLLPGPDCDRIARLASSFFNAPMAAIRLIESGGNRLLASHGMAGAESADEPFCPETIRGRDPLVVPDASLDPRFAHCAPVCAGPRIRFYAGIPLFLAPEAPAGALAVMDTRPRSRFSAGHREALRDFAALAVRELTGAAAASSGPALNNSHWLDSIAGALPAMVWLTDTAGHCTLLNRFPWDPPGDWHNVIPTEESETDSKDDLAFECRIQGRDGKDRWILEQARPRFQADGSFAGYIGLCLDITDRKRAEIELLASREQLRRLAAHVESAREQERIRIAREIHDELGQVLTVLKMDTEDVQARYRTSVPRPLKEIMGRMAAIVDNLDLTIGTVRRIASELRPGVLDHLGIAAAIEWQIQQFESHTGVRFETVGLPEELPLNAHQSTAVFRIFQEILTNIARHAAASEAKVEVNVDAAKLTLRVTDNGKGFDRLRLSDPKALGLLGMRERALLLGGAIEIESRAGAGTTVTLEIPLAGPAAAL